MPMNAEDIRRLKAMVEDLDLDEKSAMELASALIKTQKDATTGRIAFKAAAPPLRPFEAIARQTMPELYGLKGKTPR